MTETKIVAFIQHHSVVAIPFLILFCKILVRWISREAAKDVFKSLLMLPLDFIYIALALVFSGLARKIPSLAARYGSDIQADFNLAVLVVMLIAAAVAVTAMDRYVRVLWQKFYSAVSMLREASNGKSQLPLTTVDGQAITDENGRNLRIFGWLLLYWSALAPLIFLELLIGIIGLGGILRRL